MSWVVKRCKKCHLIMGACSPDALIHKANNCNGELEKLNISRDELSVIEDISTDKDFLQAMIDLREKDIIEYQVKMSQFRTQVQLQKNAKTKEYNYPKCPTCGSTNIRKISVASKIRTRALLGVYALGRTSKTFQCIHCGYEW